MDRLDGDLLGEDGLKGEERVEAMAYAAVLGERKVRFLLWGLTDCFGCCCVK
jgi:hypothetical protein